MAGTTDDHVPRRYRFTLYTVLFPLQTKDRIRAVRNLTSFADWRDQFARLQADTAFLAKFSAEEQAKLKQNAALVSEQFRVWEKRVPVREWIHWPFYMVFPPILVSVAHWVIGEPVFALRSHAYYLLLLLLVLRCAFSRYATASLFGRLHRDSWATQPIQAVLSAAAAFVPGCRFLYKTWWYILINIVATCALVHWIQYYELLEELRQDRFMRRQLGQGIGEDELVLERLNAIEPGLEFYNTQFSGYRCNYVHNTQDVLVREGAGKIVKILYAALSPEARQTRLSNLAPAGQIASLSGRKTKLWFTVGYFIAAILTIVTLTFQWGSFAQAFMALYAVGLMLVLMTIFDHYPVDAFLDFFTPKMAFLFWSLPHVNCLLIGNPTRFSDNPSLLWGTYAALAFENLLLSDLLVYYTMQYLKKKFGGTDLSP